MPINLHTHIRVLFFFFIAKCFLIYTHIYVYVYVYITRRKKERRVQKKFTHTTTKNKLNTRNIVTAWKAKNDVTHRLGYRGQNCVHIFCFCCFVLPLFLSRTRGRACCMCVCVRACIRVTDSYTSDHHHHHLNQSKIHPFSSAMFPHSSGSNSSQFQVDISG